MLLIEAVSAAPRASAFVLVKRSPLNSVTQTTVIRLFLNSDNSSNLASPIASIRTDVNHGDITVPFDLLCSSFGYCCIWNENLAAPAQSIPIRDPNDRTNESYHREYTCTPMH
jgi:hypothetical protein